MSYDDDEFPQEHEERPDFDALLDHPVLDFNNLDQEHLSLPVNIQVRPGASFSRLIREM